MSNSLAVYRFDESRDVLDSVGYLRDIRHTSGWGAGYEMYMPAHPPTREIYPEVLEAIEIKDKDFMVWSDGENVRRWQVRDGRIVQPADGTIWANEPYYNMV